MSSPTTFASSTKSREDKAVGFDLDDFLKEYQEDKSNHDPDAQSLNDQLIDYLLETDSSVKIQIAES